MPKDIERLRAFVQDDTLVNTVIAHRGKRRLFLVGGTVRDVLLNMKPVDYDFSVSGSGVTFARSLARKLKGAFVLLSEQDDEARVVKDDIIYDFIGFGKGNIDKDLLRRDFTINSMAIDCGSFKFLDPFNGLSDLKKGLIRPTSEDSLKEDALRILRGFRFSLELDFELTRDFYKLCEGFDLSKVAAERIGYEMMRITASNNSFKMILKMNSLGLFQQMFPEAEKIMADDQLWTHSMGTYEALENLTKGGFFTGFEPEFSQYFTEQRRISLLKLSGLFHDISKPDTIMVKRGEIHFYGHDVKGARRAQAIARKRLKLSRPEIMVIQKLVKEHMRLHLLATSKELTDRAIRRFFRDLGDDWLAAMMIAWADGYATAGWTRHLEEVFERMIELKRTDDAKPTEERLINGYDLIALGLKPGPPFKVILQEIYDQQLEGRIRTKEEGLALARQLVEKLSMA